MFQAKYIAVNEVTGHRIRTFKTKKGALAWYKKPMKFQKKDLGITIRKVITEQA